MVSVSGPRIVVPMRAVDFRKGHDGLASAVQGELGPGPYSGVAFVFNSALHRVLVCRMRTDERTLPLPPRYRATGPREPARGSR